MFVKPGIHADSFGAQTLPAVHVTAYVGDFLGSSLRVHGATLCRFQTRSAGSQPRTERSGRESAVELLAGAAEGKKYPMQETLREVAKIVCSKNPGPFEITTDVVFSDESMYRGVKASDALTPDRIAALYRLKPAQVLNCEIFDPALAFQATVARTVSSGSSAETDSYGGQQSAPLLDVTTVAV